MILKIYLALEWNEEKSQSVYIDISRRAKKGQKISQDKEGILERGLGLGLVYFRAPIEERGPQNTERKRERERERERERVNVIVIHSQGLYTVYTTYVQ